MFFELLLSDKGCGYFFWKSNLFVIKFQKWKNLALHLFWTDEKQKNLSKPTGWFLMWPSLKTSTLLWSNFECLPGNSFFWMPTMRKYTYILLLWPSLAFVVLWSWWRADGGLLVNFWPFQQNLIKTFQN